MICVIARKFFTVEHISLQNLSVLKFELQYEWTPPRIFFRGYHVLQLFCDNVDAAHDFKCGQNYLELKFCLPEAATGSIL